MIYHILLAFVVTFIITVVLGKIAIPMLRSLHAQQSIREEGPESHQAKAGTPTMGGAFMMIALVLGVAIFAPWNVGTGMLLFLTLGHCLLGFFDDFVKAVKKRNLGLTAKQKLLGQFILAAIFCYCITEIMDSCSRYTSSTRLGLLCFGVFNYRRCYERSKSYRWS